MKQRCDIRVGIQANPDGTYSAAIILDGVEDQKLAQKACSELVKAIKEHFSDRVFNERWLNN